MFGTKLISRPVLIWLLLYAANAYAAAPRGLDIITLRNGDIYNGTAAQEVFTLETPYGQVAVPYGYMFSLRMGKNDQPDRITTRFGDSFSGKLLEQEVTVLRVLDPTLPLAKADIAEIVFIPRPSKIKLQVTPDALIMQNGDRFAARIQTRDFLLLENSGILLTNRSDIHLLNIATDIEGVKHKVQITDNGGQVRQGKLMTEQVGVETRYGNALTLSIVQVSQMAFQVNHSGHETTFDFQRMLNPANLIRDRMRDGSLAPELIALRGGRFNRGDLQGDGDADEKPVVEIQLKPFAIGIHEITFSEYDRFCDDTGAVKPDDEGWGRGHRPVVNVSWEEARSFTHWLSRKTGETYRLPTDAEWEYAARGGTTTRFWWGNELQAYYANCEGCDSLWSGETTAPVGRFPPNAFGLRDMAGNVFEWVEDCWNDSYAEAPNDGSALVTPGCGKKVIRGGAWSFPPKEVRSANRWRDFPTRRSDDTGFRVAREL